MIKYTHLFPAPVRRRIPMTLKRRAWHFLGDKRPLLTIVVPVYNVERYLTSCLESIRSQSYRNLEIIIVDDGSTDKSHEVAKSHQRLDGRIKIIRQSNKGLGAARNTGIKAAKGKYLGFADSDDTVPKDVYARLMSTLLQSQSDFIVGSVQRVHGKKKWIPKWAQKAHALDQIGITAGEHPDILLNVFAWNKIFVRDFFMTKIGQFPTNIRYEDQEPSTVAYTAAKAFDVSTVVAYNWHSRDDGSSLSQQKSTLRDIRDRMLVMTKQEAYLRAHGDVKTYTRILAKIFGFDLWAYYDQIARQGTNYWTILHKGLADIAAKANQDIMEVIGPLDRLFVHAILTNQRDDFISIATHVDAYGKDYVLTPSDKGLTAAFPFIESLRNPLPKSAMIVANWKLQPITRIHDISFDNDIIRVKGSVYINHLAHDTQNQLQINCVPIGDTKPVRLIEFKQHLDISRFEHTQHKYLDYTKTGFLATFHRDNIHAEPAQYGFAFVYRFQFGLVEGVLDTIHRNSPATYGDCVDMATGQVYNFLNGMVPGTGKIGVLVSSMPPGSQCKTQIFRQKKRYLEVCEVNIIGMAIRISGRYKVGRGAKNIVIALFSDTGNQTLHPKNQRIGGGEFECTFDLTEHEADIAINKCVCKLKYTSAKNVTHTLWSFCALSVNAALPLISREAQCIIKMSRTPKAGAIHIHVQPPWSNMEYGPNNHSRLIRCYLDSIDAGRIQRGVFLFEAFNGSRVDDSPLQMSQWVLQNIPDADVYWSVQDYSIQAPEGMTRVIRFSESWFNLLAEAEVLINNNNFPFFFRKSKNQKYIQTWHGTPLKRIGNDVPKNNLSLAYRKLMHNEAMQWDVLLAQNDFAMEKLPRAFGYTGPVLCEGYPRNDPLNHIDPKHVEAIKHQLDIPQNKKVLLYAPTWRDNVKHGGRYKLEVFLDLDTFTKEAEDYVLLLRGHPNTLHSPRTNREVIDVRDYPKINDLYLVADVMVTDYSSVMFDFAITEKPILFLTPDIETYSESTRGFYLDFRKIAPGPLCTSTSELVEHLKNIDTIQATYESRYHEFRNTFCSKEDGDATARVMSALKPLMTT